jgi:glycosidase
MEGDKSKGDGWLREDFPGGWPGDTKSVLAGTGLSDQETEALEFTKRILNWRKAKDVIHTGKLKHYIPNDGVYVYFRYNREESVMVIINLNDKDGKMVNGEKYAESLKGFTGGTDIISGRKVEDLNSFTVAPKTAMIIELK